MSLNLNLCTSTLPGFDCNDAIDIARQSGFQGIELWVKDDGHKSLNQLASEGELLKRQITKAGLKLPVLNTFKNTWAMKQLRRSDHAHATKTVSGRIPLHICLFVSLELAKISSFETKVTIAF